MKASVWVDLGAGKTRKCVWRGSVASVPRAGDWVVLKDGFCAEHVRDVVYDLTADPPEAELTLLTTDEQSDYPDLDEQPKGKK